MAKNINMTAGEFIGNIKKTVGKLADSELACIYDDANRQDALVGAIAQVAIAELSSRHPKRAQAFAEAAAAGEPITARKAFVK